MGCTHNRMCVRAHVLLQRGLRQQRAQAGRGPAACGGHPGIRGLRAILFDEQRRGVRAHGRAAFERGEPWRSQLQESGVGSKFSI